MHLVTSIIVIKIKDMWINQCQKYFSYDNHVYNIQSGII